MQEIPLTDVVDSRHANAFFKNANVSEEMTGLLSDKNGRAGFRLFPKIISRQIDIGRGKQGGLWVGGKSVLTTSTLGFNPNTVNQAMHADPEDMEINILLSSISAISVHRGYITDVIDVRHAAGVLKIRCFKAKSFAASIETARLALR